MTGCVWSKNILNKLGAEGLCVGGSGGNEQGYLSGVQNSCVINAKMIVNNWLARPLLHIMDYINMWVYFTVCTYVQHMKRKTELCTKIDTFLEMCICILAAEMHLRLATSTVLLTS